MMNDFNLLGKNRSSSSFNQKLAKACGVIFFGACLALFSWCLYLYSVKNRLHVSYKKSIELMNQLEAAHKKHQQTLRDSRIVQEQRSAHLNNKNCIFYGMLQNLASLMPSDMRLVGLDFIDKQLLMLQGEALSAKSLTNFVNILKLKPCFERCVLEGMSKKQTKERAYFDFTIKVYLNEDHGQNKKIGAR